MFSVVFGQTVEEMSWIRLLCAFAPKVGEAFFFSPLIPFTHIILSPSLFPFASVEIPSLSFHTPLLTAAPKGRCLVMEFQALEQLEEHEPKLACLKF